MPDFNQLLAQTSRTFGLSIPLLDEPLRRRLTLAYLLFRVADTLEDAEHLSYPVRAIELVALRDAVRSGDRSKLEHLVAGWMQKPLTSHEGYLDLLRSTPALVAAIRQLDPPATSLIFEHACRTMDGMASFVRDNTGNGTFCLRTLSELRRYCYVVAGIVGELITELLLADVTNLRPAAASLRQDASLFGEGLQLVNMLKDADDDARLGRQFLPPEVKRGEVFGLAYQDLHRAEQYLRTLKDCRVKGGIVPFVELPIRLAHGTLRRVQEQGAGAKLSRGEVAAILSASTQAIGSQPQSGGKKTS